MKENEITEVSVGSKISQLSSYFWFLSCCSGGKDSCFNLLQCVAEGHQIVALANLRPKDKGEWGKRNSLTLGMQN